MMARLIAVLSGLLCATNALRPQTRHQFLQNVVKGAALLPAAATASTRDYTPADEDMKGLLSSFTTELDDKDKKAAQKKIDDAKPLQEKIKAEFDAKKEEAAKPRPGPGVATPRVKKKVERRMGDGGGMSGYSSLGY
mmetsp:Transcript_8497/g.25252  ORF Transcript_8497/g.25252 Transcript_8497/m.25252 type:complete len:137 (+) Transcript_8497:108-518(+)